VGEKGTLLQQLSGGDRRSIGAAKEAAQQVLQKPELLAELFEGMTSADPVLRMRCADVAEKVTAHHPEWLAPYKKILLGELSHSEQQEVRWHVAPMLIRLPLSKREEGEVLHILLDYTQDKSSIVKTMAMQAMADLGLGSDQAELRQKVVHHIEDLTAVGTPAMRARGKKLLAKLAKYDP